MAQISTYLPLLPILGDAAVFRATLGHHLALLRPGLDQDNIFGPSAGQDLLQLLESSCFLDDPGLSVTAARPTLL